MIRSTAELGRCQHGPGGADATVSVGCDPGERVAGGPAGMRGVAAAPPWPGTCGNPSCTRCHGEYNSQAALRRHLLDGVRSRHSPIASVLTAVEVRMHDSSRAPVRSTQSTADADE